VPKPDLTKPEISQTKPSRFKKPTKLTKNITEEKNLRQSDLTKKYAEESQATINQNFDQRQNEN
jgi:hypothetical protein